MRATEKGITFEYESCTVCNGGCKKFIPRLQRFIDCPTCGGKGVLVTSHICACGAPVRTLSNDDNILYCGRDQCLKDLREDAKEDKLGPTQESVEEKPIWNDYELPGPWPGYGRRWAE